MLLTIYKVVDWINICYFKKKKYVEILFHIKIKNTTH